MFAFEYCVVLAVLLVVFIVCLFLLFVWLFVVGVGEFCRCLLALKELICIGVFDL